MITNEIQKSTRKRLKSIDILKGIAIIMVILVHYYQKFFKLNPIIRNISSYGQMGCQLFFLISGFTLSMSYSKEEQKTTTFYKKRYINIAPAYYIMLIFYIILNFILTNIVHKNLPCYLKHDFLGIFINVLFLNGFSYTYNNCVFPGGWFIGTIMIFYFIFPAIYSVFKKIENKNKKVLDIIPYIVTIVSVIIQLIIGFINGTQKYSVNSSFIYFSIINQLSSMLLGVTLFFKYKENELEKYTIKETILKTIFWLIVSISFFYSGIPFIFTVVPFVATKSFYWLFILINYNIDKINIKIQKFLSKWGEISYEAFLIHIFFVFYISSYFQQGLKYIGININSTLLYFILLIPMYMLIFYTSKFMKNKFDKIQEILKRKIL